MSPPPPPPPPPPPLCFPFNRKKSKGKDEKDGDSHLTRSSTMKSDISRDSHIAARLVRSGSYSPTATVLSQADKLTFDTDSETYEIPPLDKHSRPKLTRSNTQTGTKKSLASSQQSQGRSLGKWGYGWGIGKVKAGAVKEKESHGEKDLPHRPDSLASETRPPLYEPPTRQSSKSSKTTQSSSATARPSSSRRPTLLPKDSTSTLVGSALERKMNDGESIKERPDTALRLEELRKLMQKDNLDY
jgi:Xaa-Pro aminopeptidase